MSIRGKEEQTKKQGGNIYNLFRHNQSFCYLL